MRKRSSTSIIVKFRISKSNLNITINSRLKVLKTSSKKSWTCKMTALWLRTKIYKITTKKLFRTTRISFKLFKIVPILNFNHLIIFPNRKKQMIPSNSHWTKTHYHFTSKNLNNNLSATNLLKWVIQTPKLKSKTMFQLLLRTRRENHFMLSKSRGKENEKKCFKNINSRLQKIYFKVLSCSEQSTTSWTHSMKYLASSRHKKLNNEILCVKVIGRYTVSVLGGKTFELKVVEKLIHQTFVIWLLNILNIYSIRLQNN